MDLKPEITGMDNGGISTDDHNSTLRQKSTHLGLLRNIVTFVCGQIHFRCHILSPVTKMFVISYSILTVQKIQHSKL